MKVWIKDYKITDFKGKERKSILEIYHNLFLKNIINDTNLNNYLDRN